MTLGEKIKEARKAAGLSQEQFAEKMNVSRSAVAKWETDKGLPDIGNLKVMADLLHVSVDNLIDDGSRPEFNEISEPIDLSAFEKTGKCRSKQDAACVAKNANADAIYALIRSKKLSVKEQIADFVAGPGIIQGIHNLDSSIENFARCCFMYALDQKISVWFATKDTISKTYDGNFKEIFQRVFDAEFKAKFDAAGIEYFYTLIDDAVARVMKCDGGILWACKNYDGDVMSDMIASACGSLAMMTSVLVSPTGEFEYEASHGTVQKHYYRWQKGEKTSTNPVALIFAWTGALAKRAEKDGTPELAAFAKKLEAATLGVIEDGVMTGDLARLASPAAKRIVDSWEFIDEIASRLN